VLLSAKAGSRAAEIAALTWEMVADAQGRVGSVIELHDSIAKKRSGRRIPIHPTLRAALIDWRRWFRRIGASCALRPMTASASSSGSTGHMPRSA